MTDRKNIEQMRRERAARHAAISERGIQNTAQVRAQFGVSYPTAARDLRAVYGKLPALAPKSIHRPARKYAKESGLGGKSVHVNLYMLETQQQQVKALAAKRNTSVGAIIRWAVRLALLEDDRK